MSYILSEQEKSLLSAFHDGEATATEAATAQQLLDRSAAARAWLRDARSVRTMSVEAAMRVPLPPLSGKLTGSAIVAAAAKQGALSGGGFFAAARSPFGLAGAAALLVAGAIWTVQDLRRPVQPNTSVERAAIAPGNNPAVAGTQITARNSPPQVDANGLMVPPITAHDLAGFALDGTLPINTARTQFAGMEESDGAPELPLVREIAEGMGALEPLQVQALDSLAELLRSSIVRLQGNGWAVRQDLPDLRLAVIDRLEKAHLSGTARRQLQTARKEARKNQTQLSTSLQNGISAMETSLLAASERPYVLIESNETVENPTGDKNGIAVLKMIGKRNRIITLDPQAIRISEPNTSLAAATLPEPTRRKRTSAQAASAEVPPATTQPQADTQAVNSAVPQGWKWIAAEPFIQSVTISIFSNERMAIIISDEMDTTWQSQTRFIREGFDALGSRIDTLTDKLNAQISRIAGNRSKPPETRAREIMKAQLEYQMQLEQMLNAADTVITPNSPVQPQSDSLKAKDPLQEAAEHDALKDAQPLESTCMPWEDCSGVG